MKRQLVILIVSIILFGVGTYAKKKLKEDNAIDEKSVANAEEKKVTEREKEEVISDKERAESGGKNSTSSEEFDDNEGFLTKISQTFRSLFHTLEHISKSLIDKIMHRSEDENASNSTSTASPTTMTSESSKATKMSRLKKEPEIDVNDAASNEIDDH